MFKRVAELGIIRRLHPSRSIPPISLYADDVVLFCHPQQEDIDAVKAILQLFGRASSLRVNFTKSTATLIRCDDDAVLPVVESLGCPIVAFPITYLGIPLTIRRPTTAQLLPLVDKVAGRLPTWKAWLMNRASRLALVISVLAVIPLHQMLVLVPPKKILRMLKRIQRGFLWAGRAEANGGHCHVNWRRVARPRCLGGLGVHDLERIGMVLRTRWLWLRKTDERRAWAGLSLQFSAEEQAFFIASTHTSIGNGHSTKF
uniref:Reverse transcriptase domain-containing protein n=1 Tax=Aegilops tauschii subsp. strangulata TaxID=200361 RepID=A0A453I048_AEGTS